jgi:hypothetical protein
MILGLFIITFTINDVLGIYYWYLILGYSWSDSDNVKR